MLKIKFIIFSFWKCLSIEASTSAKVSCYEPYFLVGLVDLFTKGADPNWGLHQIPQFKKILGAGRAQLPITGIFSSSFLDSPEISNFG